MRSIFFDISKKILTLKKNEVIIKTIFFQINFYQYSIFLTNTPKIKIRKGGGYSQNMNRKLISHSNYVLRQVLNKKQELEILKDFLQAILEIEIQEISLNPYLEEKSKYLPREENFGIADLRIKTQDEEMNIGIQFLDGIYVQTKMLLYYAQVHLNQTEYDKKREFVKTITINILDFNCFSGSEYDRKIEIKSKEGNFNLQEMEFRVIELNKFIEKEKMTKKEEWICYLKGNTNKQILNKIIENNVQIKKLDELLKKYWLEEKME